MLFLALSSLRARWVSFIGVLITVAAAVTLMTATGALLEAGVRGAVPPERLSGAAIVVAGDQSIIEIRGSGENRESVRSDATERVRLPSSMASRIASIEGVETVVSERSFPASLIVARDTQPPDPAGGLSLGHSWASAAITPFELTSGRPPTQDQEIVVDVELARRAGIVVGSTTRLVAGGVTIDAEVVGIATPKSGSSLMQQSTIFFSEQNAERLYAHAGEVDLFGVQLAAGADPSDVSNAVKSTLGDDVSVLTGNKRGRAEFVDAAESNMRLIAISGSLGGIGLFVAVLVIAGMLSLFVQQRQREIALLRAMGATPRQVRRMIARETLIVTAVGAAVGVWPGLWLASRLAEAMQGRGLLPGTFEIDPAGIPVAAAVGITLLASQISAFVAGRRAGKVRPVEALTSAAAPSARMGAVRSTLAAFAVAGTGALFVTTKSVRGSLAPAVALGLFCTAVLAVGLLAPLLVRAGLRMLALPVGGLSGVGGFLAVANTRSQARRLASAVTPLALTVGIAGMTVFQQATLEREARAQSAERLVADHVVDAGPAGLRLDAITELAEHSAGTVIGLAPTTVFANYELDPYVATAVTPGQLGDVLDLGIVEGSFAQPNAGEVMLSEDAAASIGVGVGEPVDIRLGDGTASAPTIVAIYERSLGFGDVVLPWQLVERHLTDAVISLVLVDDGGDAPAARTSLARFETDHPGTQVGGREIVQAAEDANAETQAWVGYILLGLVIAFCTFAVFNTLMLAISERGREFALLRLTGGTYRQVVTMMIMEAVMVVVIGLMLGTAIAATTVMPVAKAVTGSFQPHSPPMYVAAIVTMTAVIGLAGTLLPTIARLRSRPVDAIGARE